MQQKTQQTKAKTHTSKDRVNIKRNKVKLKHTQGFSRPDRRQNETSRPSSCRISAVTLGRSETLQNTEVIWDLSPCLFVDFLCKIYQASCLSFTVPLFTLKVHKLYKDLDKDKRAISCNTCGQTHTKTHTHTHTHTHTPLTVTVTQVGHVSLFNILLERQSAEEERHSH